MKGAIFAINSYSAFLLLEYVGLRILGLLQMIHAPGADGPGEAAPGAFRTKISQKRFDRLPNAL